MSEENKLENEEGEVVPGEMTPNQEKAMSSGWRPEDEWEGEPDDWVDAKEFNLRGELMGRISKQTKQIGGYETKLADMGQAIKDLTDHNRKMAEIDRDSAIRSLNRQKAEAMDEQDSAKVIAIDSEIDQLKRVTFDEPMEAPPQAQQPLQEPPEVTAWLADPKNSWYHSDPILRGVADSVARQVYSENPQGAVVDHLVEVENRMKNDPKLSAMFEGTDYRPNGGKSRSTVNSPKSGSRKAKSKVQASDMNEGQREIAKRFVAQGIFENEQEYAVQLAELGELG